MKDFITYELALELKQLGFAEPCFAWYDSEYQDIPYYDHANNSDGWLFGNNCSAPTYSHAFRFFREKYNIHAWIINAEDNHNMFKPFFRGINIHDQHLVDFYKTYEEAELACLVALIKIVKKQNFNT